MFVRRTLFFSLFCAILLGAPNTHAQNTPNFFKGAAKVLKDVERKIKRQNRTNRSNRSTTTKKKRKNFYAQYDRATRRLIQKSLNQRGFDAGPVDGAFGKRTYRAIKAFKLSMGWAATTEMTPDQIDTLLKRPDGGSAAEPTNNANFEILMDHDLPGLDYANSGNNRRLQNLSMAQCQQICAQEQRCGAFTYNARVQWCLLKSGAVNPVPFKGAVSGRKVAGGVTNASLNSNSNPVSNGFDRSNYHPFKGQSDFNLQLELAKRTVQTLPTAIDRDKVVSTWIKEEYQRLYYGKGKQNATEMSVKFYDGTDFDRRDAIDHYRQEFLNSATDKPLKFSISWRVALFPGQFKEGKGIPVHFRGEGNYQKANASIKQVSVRVDHLRESVKFFFDDAPGVGMLPVDEKRAREIATLLNDNPYNHVKLTAYINLASINDVIMRDKRLDGYSTSAKLDAVEITIEPRKRSKIASKERIFLWNLIAQGNADEADRAGEIRAYADWLGIPVREGRLMNYRNLYFTFERSKRFPIKQHRSHWHLLQYLGQLQANPDLLKNDELLIDYADRTLSRVDKRTVSRGKDLFYKVGSFQWGKQAYSEFEAQDVINDLRTNYSNKILARTPPFPIPAIEVIQLQLGKYDFERKGFPIRWVDQSGSRMDNGVMREFSIRFDSGYHRARNAKMPGQRVSSNFKTFPQFLPMDPQEARAFSARLEAIPFNRGKRFVYIALETDIPAPTKAGKGIAYDFDITKATLFTDFELTEKLMDFEVDSGWKSAETLLANHKKGDAVPITLDTAYLLVSQLQPDLLKKEGFLQRAAEHRRQIERKAKKDSLYVPKYLPPLVIKSTKNMDANDKKAFAKLYSDLSHQTEFGKIRIPGGLHMPSASGDPITINLDQYFRNRLQQDSDITNVAKQLYPNAFGVYQILESNNRLGFVIAVNDQSGLFGFDMPRPDKNQNDYGFFDGYVDLKIEDLQLARDKRGKTVIVANAKPALVAMRNSDDSLIEHRFDAMASKQSNTSGDYELVDIRGVRLGMPYAKAAETARANSDETLEEESQQEMNLNKPWLTQGRFLYQLSGKERIGTHLGFFTEGSDTNTLLAVTFSQRFLDKKVDPNVIRNLLIKKYGQPDHQSGPRLGWVVSKQHKKRINGNMEKAGCFARPLESGDLSLIDLKGIQGHDGLEAIRKRKMAVEGSSWRVNIWGIKRPCGVIVTADIEDQELSILMMDTDRSLAYLQNRTQKQQAKEKAEKVKETENIVKF